MPTAADEFEPPAELIQSLLASEVLPRLASFENDGCPQLFARTFIVVRDLKTLIGVFGSSGELDIQSNGELRMRMRKTINENRVVWRIESLFPNVMPSTGFVGFDSNGDAIGHEGQWIVKNAPELPIGRFLKSKSLGGNRVILVVPSGSNTLRVKHL